jgi:ABC-type long-subunit fatty acid transport system fused permease/ATPase subunit
MFRSYFLSWKWARSAYGGAFLVAVLTYIQVKISWLYADWLYVLGSVYSNGEKYTPEQLINEFALSAIMIAAISIVFNALHTYVSRKYCWCWYEASMKYYFPNWNKTLRDISNPSERLQDSTESFTARFFNMTKAIVHASLMLWVFVPKLWDLSSKFNFFSLGRMSGMLVWVGLILCLIGYIITALSGYNLKKCKYDIKTARGYLRSGLEYVQRNKNKEDSIPNLENLIKKTRKATFRLFDNQFWFDIWMGVYTQFWAVAPKIFFGYNVFSGYVKYGNVTKTENVLGQVYAAISTPIWLWDEYTEFLSVAQRLREMEETINNPENWKEAKKEEGWEDRRAEQRNPVFFVDPLFGGKVKLTEEEVAFMRESIKNRPHIWE